jgi:predicted enzyme related to lactoylglutathione lyase
MDIDKHDHGVPSWVDLSTSDVDAAVAFYGGLFGWDLADLGEEAGHYHMASLRGRSVAAISPAQNPGPSYWTTYVTVDDADAAASAAKDAGGNVMAEPFEVMDAGRMAVLADPTGAAFAVWQPGTSIGAEIVNEPNTYGWSELVTSDVDGAKTFYGAVFGWGNRTMGEGAGAYTEWLIGERSVGGMMARPPQLPAQAPDFWGVYFTVEDCAAAASRVTELGGSVMMGPQDIEPGTFAVVADPTGAMFNVIQLKAGLGSR